MKLDLQAGFTAQEPVDLAALLVDFAEYVKGQEDVNRTLDQGAKVVVTVMVRNGVSGS